MDKRCSDPRAPKGATPSPGAIPRDGANGQTDAGAFLSAPIVPHTSPLFKSQSDGDDLGAALEHTRGAYWRAADVHDWPQADYHAAQYRRLFKGASMRELQARLEALERVLLEQERRLDALETEQGGAL